MTNLSKHIAFEVCYASLKRRSMEFFPCNDIRTFNADEPPIFWTPLSFNF